MEKQLPGELWLEVFTFLPFGDKQNVRATCSHFKHLLDKSRALWRDLNVTLRDFSRYNRPFWRSLAQRHVGSVTVRAGKQKHLKQLSTWLPSVSALRLDGWQERVIDDLTGFRELTRLSLTSCSVSLRNFNFLYPMCGQLTRLSLCNVTVSIPGPLLLAAICQLTRMTSLLLHHDGNVKIATLSGVLAKLTELKQLSVTMVTYKTLPTDYFRPEHLPDGAVCLSELQLLNYDAVVTQEVLRPLSRLLRLSITHLYSVPGPTCHLTTWLSCLPQLQSLTVHGGHPLSVYADFLPPSLTSLTLNVDLQPEDLHKVSVRTPNLTHLHLEPWSHSPDLLKPLPHLFPNLQTLKIRHHNIPDSDFLSLSQLTSLHSVYVLDAYHRPDPTDPGWVVYRPGPRLLNMTSQLHQRTNHRVRVIMTSHRDPLACQCE